uniref:Uncharacterized protein B18E6.010 n=1 Tax=Neurospora crassa TaxID=5141 RepID=Q873M3_NEUCS|nr:hypothetical protein [Neurospora crassa]
MAPRRHQLSQPRKVPILTISMLWLQLLYVTDTSNWMDMKATKAGKKRRQKHKTALKAETKEKKIEASDRQMNTTSAEILVLKRKLGEQRRAHEELVKKHETAETEAELMARLASVEHDDDDDGPKAAAAASKHKKRRDNKRFRFGQFNRLYRRRDRQQENDVQVRNSTSAPAIEVE